MNKIDIFFVDELVPFIIKRKLGVE
jgi:hypothetical protein